MDVDLKKMVYSIRVLMATQTSINCQLDSKYVSTGFCNTDILCIVILTSQRNRNNFKLIVV